MLHRTLCRAALGLALLSTPAFAQSYEDGTAAFNKGDYVAAVKIWKPLADQGLAKAQFISGVMYANGQGVGPSSKDATKWWTLAAAQGYAPAQLDLARAYVKGDGVDKNSAEAAAWFRKAADRGDSEAQAELGTLYNRGEGVARDDKEAVKWFRAATGQGYTPAMSDLGFMYEKGQGVAQDKIRAHMYFNLAVAASSGKEAEVATQNRDRVAAGLTPDQIKTARDLARKCMQNNYKNCD